MTVNFYLERKVSAQKETTIWCYVREGKETFYLNTNQKVNPELWDSKVQRASLRKTRDNIEKGNLKSLNQYLTAFEQKIFDIERSVRKKDFSTGFWQVIDELKDAFTKKKNGFFDLYDEYIGILNGTGISKNHISKHKRTKDLLLEYQKINRERLHFEKINCNSFDKLKIFLMSNTELIDNTINKHLKLFKSFLIWAYKSGYTTNISYKNYKLKFEDNEIIYLSEDELMNLYKLNLTDERLSRVRDIFIFQCFTGVRYSDIQNLSREDIKGAEWYLRTQKTHDPIRIPLNSFAISILAKYVDYPQPLPVISNQKMNDYLKELCKLAEINEAVKIVKYQRGKRIETIHKKYELLGTHTARRTFVSLSLQRGMKPDVIMKITGHKTYAMMKKYLNIADKYTREEMDKTWGPALRVITQSEK